MDLSKRKILIARDDIARRVQELGQQITDDYRASDRPLFSASIIPYRRSARNLDIAGGVC